MTSGRLRDMVIKILNRKGNKYAKQLLMGECVSGGKKKQQKIENWVQVELAKDLKGAWPNHVVVIEEGNTDIVIKPPQNVLSGHVGIELKIQGTRGSLYHDWQKLSNFSINNADARGFLIALVLCKAKDRYESWEKAIYASAPLKAIREKFEFCKLKTIEPDGKGRRMKVLGVFCGEALVG
ncbi:MAG: hypothetical protein BWY44_01465 [Candidatus Omnitrophica bacterium ADurb.Bin292]|nr:MAG: hypothetical protein BWY44_01465 [Candidatus Omnitrophica bacterium ADurb.Bin292]